MRAAGADRLELQCDGTPVTIDAKLVSDGVAEIGVTWRASGGLASRESEVMPRLEEVAQAVGRVRSGLLRCPAVAGGIDVRMTVCLEGISCQSFMSAIAEVWQAYMSLERTAGDFDGQREAPALSGQAERCLGSPLPLGQPAGAYEEHGRDA